MNIINHEVHAKKNLVKIHLTPAHILQSYKVASKLLKKKIPLLEQPVDVNMVKHAYVVHAK